MSKRTLTALIIGPSGHGKSWLGATTPPPRLIVDLEGRAHYTPAGRDATEWDGLSDPMQLTPSPSRTYIVTVTSVQVLDSIRAWLKSGKHPFVSVTVDSLMEAQMRTTDSIRPGGQALQTQDWGTLLRTMQGFVRDVRDLTLVPATKVTCAVFIAGAKKDDSGYIKPMMQGQISSQLPYFMDLVGYMEKVRDAEGSVTRRLWIDQRPQNDLEVKDGTNDIFTAYGPCVESPDFTKMYEALRPESGKE